MGRAVSDLRVGKLTIVLYWSSCRPGGGSRYEGGGA